MSSPLRVLRGRVRVAPVEAWNFLSPRTFLLAMGVGAIVGNMVGGAGVATVVGLAVYVLAAVHPENRTTCPLCGELVNPRAAACRACGRDLV